jgi:hypothetical protein
VEGPALRNLGNLKTCETILLERNFEVPNPSEILEDERRTQC